jgi:hypothetical protein
MNTTTEKTTRRIVLFENEVNQKGMRALITGQRIKLLAVMEAYNQVRETAPELFPEFSFDQVTAIMRARSVRDWLFDKITGDTPLHLGGLRVPREKALTLVEYPAGAEQLEAAMKITPADLNFMQECFRITGSELVDDADGIEKKIDSCRRYASSDMELEMFDVAAEVAATFTKLLRVREKYGFVPSYLNMGRGTHPECVQVHVESSRAGDTWCFVPNSHWVLQMSRS